MKHRATLQLYGLSPVVRISRGELFVFARLYTNIGCTTEVNFANFLLFVSIFIFLHLLITYTVKFFTKIRFIPHNVPINLLVKTQNNNSMSEEICTCCYLLFINVLILDETAFLFIFLRQSFLDEYCFRILLFGTKLNIFIVNTGFRTAVNILL